MSFIGTLIQQMDRSTAGSEETAREVLRMCGAVSPKNALFFGDDVFTPRLISESLGTRVLATFNESSRVREAEEAGLTARAVGAYELVRGEAGWDFVWYNGSAEPDGVSRRLEQLRECLNKGATAVYRTLCWLIDPSPDTKGYVERRFGRPEPLDRVLREAKEQGFKIKDFYIAPKTDWTHGFYQPLTESLSRLEGAAEAESGDVSAGIGEVNKDVYMFDLHSEEYSFVYYILGC